jgi:hypothetical protein
VSDADEPSPQDRPLPPPDLPSVDLQPAATTLEQLLEQASRVQAARFGNGTLVGECLDTHNPHLPHRVLVRARDEDGMPVVAWLPKFAELRVRAGHKVLLSKPENWPEPVVIGVVAGLERPDEQPARQPAEQPAPEQPSLRLEQGQALVITDPAGQPIFELRATIDGPRIALLGADVSLEAPGSLRIGAERIELSARAGGVDIRTDGDAIVRGRVIRLN